MIDLTSAAERLATLVRHVPDEALPGPTPCADTSLATLLDHVDGLARGLAATARKDLSGTSAPTASAEHLPDDWREGIAERLRGLAGAWQDPAAWEGDTQAGGVPLPGAVAGLVTADELVVHAWDVARSTRQAYEADPAAVQGALAFARGVVQEAGGAGTEGLFGPALPVPEGCSALDEVLRLTGRDPAWQHAAGSRTPTPQEDS